MIEVSIKTREKNEKMEYEMFLREFQS